MKRHAGIITTLLAVWLASGQAHAQSAPTCLFDAGTRTLTVTVNGDVASLSVSAAGAIKLNNVKCTGATTTTTDLVRVIGGALADKVTVVEPELFSPGATAETSGLSEIELNITLNGGQDTVTLIYTDGPDNAWFRDWGVDIHHDGDPDIWTTNEEILKLKMKGGDDVVIASPYIGSSKLFLYGGSGNDTLKAGGSDVTRLYGEDGNDDLSGSDSFFYGGPGNDICHSFGGFNFFVADATYDGDDEYYGAPFCCGKATIDYSKRTNGVSITPDDGLANDGEPGVEADFVDENVDNLTGGEGDDVLIGTSRNNKLTGNGGDDTLYGGQGKDEFDGDDGDDVILNDDGITESVNCGPGTDDAQPSNDNFTACELI